MVPLNPKLIAADPITRLRVLRGCLIGFREAAGDMHAFAERALGILETLGISDIEICRACRKRPIRNRGLCGPCYNRRQDKTPRGAAIRAVILPPQTSGGSP